MARYRYLVVGGGMTADAAVRGIRDVDPSGSIGLISAETHPPYARPPLSKGLWRGGSPDKIWRGTAELGADLHLGRTVQSLDLAAKRAVDNRGTVYAFDRLLLATGGTPRRLPSGADEGVIYFRTLDDYERLRAWSEHRRRFAIVGCGFIGTEIAAALAMNGRDVVMLFPEDGVGARMFPAGLARSLNEYYRGRGVDVRAGEAVETLQATQAGAVIETSIGRMIEVEGVVAGLGIVPAIGLAHAAGLRIDNGIAVDELLRTNHPDVYAAGDVAAFINPALGRRIRVEHEDNANTMGRHAGRNMAGEALPYHHLPFFYSDLFDLGYEAVGELDPHLTTYEDWKDPYKEGVVYYLRDGRVRGVLLWNVWGQVDAARALIAEPGPFRPEDLRGRLPAA
ncbi:MAG: FAD-dependent oxidoreductase [Armatimonadota bacterium]|nr:FAD-dependent oxidoreductase [Armatimonadota bacterium]